MFQKIGLKHTEAVVYALIEILHSLLFYEYSDFQHSQINTISKYYLDFLSCEDVAVSYTAKLALSRALKPHVFGKNKQNLARGDNPSKDIVESNKLINIKILTMYICCIIYIFNLVKESSNKEPESEEQIPQESPEENIQYEVDEPIILLDPRGDNFSKINN